MSLLSGFILVLAVSMVAAMDVTITTSRGSITGTTSNLLGVEVYRFKGIPYAKPPVGDLRFAKPQPYGDFPGGSLDGRNYGAVCSNLAGTRAMGSEDCLFLNVFTPSNATMKPVMLWIHGGSFVAGSSNLYPSDMIVATQDVVVVTINYRLNVFGFLSSHDSALPGNYGMWDQRLAIEWVKDNIADYGGNPNMITLFGESAGAFCISYHLVSPLNDHNLFQRAITESGSSFSMSFATASPAATFSKVISAVDCTYDDLLKCLRSKTTEELIKATKGPSGLLSFQPVLDDDYLPKDFAVQLGKFVQNSYVLKPDINMANFRKFDVFSGWNEQEGLLYMQRLNTLNEMLTGKNISKGITEPVLFAALVSSLKDVDERVAKVITTIVIDYYINTPFPMNSDDRSADDRRLETYVNIVGDFRLKLPSIVHLQLHSIISSANTFAYHFRHKRTATPALWYEGPDWLRSGSDHADELIFVLGFPLIPDDATCMAVFGKPSCGNFTSGEVELSRKVLSHWGNFAKTGNPGSDYQPFKYRDGQNYTILQTGTLEIHSHPLNDVQRLQTATEAALLQMDSHEVTDGTELCKVKKDEYLSGLMTLTPQEANKVLTTLFVLCVLLAIVALVLIISAIAAKVKDSRSGSKYA